MFQPKNLSFTTLALAGAVLVGGLTAGNATAGGDGDLMFYVDPSDPTELLVGRYIFESDIIGDPLLGTVSEILSEPIAISEFENDWESTGSPGTDEPGLATDGSAPEDEFPTPLGNIVHQFPAGTTLTATGNVLPVVGRNVGFWDGTGPVTFGASPHGIEVESPFESFPQGFAKGLDFDGGTSAPTGEFTGGAPAPAVLSPWTSSVTGTEHDHFEFILDATDAAATPGIYLLSLTFQAGSAVSEDQYFIFGYNDGSLGTEPQFDQLLEDAEEFVETSIIPEPASVLLMAAAGGLALVRRR